MLFEQISGGLLRNWKVHAIKLTLNRKLTLLPAKYRRWGELYLAAGVFFTPGSEINYVA